MSLPDPPLTNYIADCQQKAWQALIQVYGEPKLQKHPAWEWTGDNWLPRYSYQPVTQLSEIWDEWSTGLNGFLSTRELEEGWGAKWRRNNPGLKTENGRRKKVVQLVEELSRKPGWSIKLALRFLQDKYEGTFKSPRKFCEYLQARKNVGYHEVLAAANMYP
jgi:Transcriptional activator of glycolytic enzymes